jgi:hypothetical protein
MIERHIDFADKNGYWRRRRRASPTSQPQQVSVSPTQRPYLARQGKSETISSGQGLEEDLQETTEGRRPKGDGERRVLTCYQQPTRMLPDWAASPKPRD